LRLKLFLKPILLKIVT